MYKSTQQSNDYLTRSGSFSTHATARGLVKVPPKQAIAEELRTQETILAQRKHLVEQVNRVDREIVDARKRYDYARLRDLTAQKANLDGTLGSMKRVLLLAQEETRAWVFHALARQLLSEETVKFLNLEVEAILEESRRLAGKE